MRALAIIVLVSVFAAEASAQEVVVSDLEVVDLRFGARGDADVWTGEAWTALGAGVVDEIAGDLASVTVQVHAADGIQLRVLYKADGDWAASGWTDRFAFRVEAGALVEYVVETRAGTSTIGTHGYVKIKKLNSGG